MPAKNASGRLSSNANQTGGREPSGVASFSENDVNGTTHRLSTPSHRRQCGEETLRTFVTPGSLLRPFRAKPLAFPLAHHDRKRVGDPESIMSQILAERRADHLGRAGFVVFTKPPLEGHSQLGQGFEGAGSRESKQRIEHHSVAHLRRALSIRPSCASAATILLSEAKPRLQNSF